MQVAGQRCEPSANIDRRCASSSVPGQAPYTNPKTLALPWDCDEGSDEALSIAPSWCPKSCRKCRGTSGPSLMTTRRRALWSEAASTRSVRWPDIAESGPSLTERILPRCCWRPILHHGMGHVQAGRTATKKAGQLRCPAKFLLPLRGTEALKEGANEPRFRGTQFGAAQKVLRWRGPERRNGPVRRNRGRLPQGSPQGSVRLQVHLRRHRRTCPAGPIYANRASLC